MVSYIADVVLTHPDMVLNRTIAAVSDIEASIDYQTMTESGDVYLFFEVYCEDFAAFDAAVADDPTVADSTVAVDSDGFRVYRMRLLSTDHLVLPKAAELGLRVLHATSAPGGWRAKIEGQERDDLAAFRQHCAEHGVGFALQRLYRHDNSRSGAAYGLTPAQYEALHAAFERGYFDEPRAASLGDIAETLDISRSAAGGRINRGVERLLRSTIAQSGRRPVKQ